MRLTLDDAVCDVYLTYAHAQGRDINSVITDQLRRFRSLEPGKKAIVIPPSALDAIEQRVGGPPIVDGVDLAKRLEGLAGITFEGVRIRLSEGQMAELVNRAARQGKPVAALVEEIVAVITRDFFYTSGGGPAVEPPAPPVKPPAPPIPPPSPLARPDRTPNPADDPITHVQSVLPTPTGSHTAPRPSAPQPPAGPRPAQPPKPPAKS